MAAQLELALGGVLQASTASKKRGEWEDERMLQLMMGPVERPSSNSSYSSLLSNTCKQQQRQQPSHFDTTPTPTPTLDLFGKGPPPQQPHEDDDDDDETSSCFELDSHSPLPPGWEKCLDLTTGSIYYLNRSTGLSTSCDPRKATASVNWPTSPSSSSDLTFEANGPIPSSTSKPTSEVINGDGSNASSQLDLNLSLRPSSRSLPRSSVNNDQTRKESNHNLRSFISSHGLLNKYQSFTSSSALPLNATSNSKSSTALPTCTFSATTSMPSSSSPSTLTLQELNALKDNRGRMAPTISSKFEVEQISKPININQNINAISKPFSNNPNININCKLLSNNNLPSSPMITVGCANCLMFVMLPKSCNPKCPRCGASIDSDLPQPPSKKAKLGFSLMY